MSPRYDAIVVGAGHNGLPYFSASFLTGDGIVRSPFLWPCRTGCSLLQSRGLCGF